MRYHLSEQLVQICSHLQEQLQEQLLHVLPQSTANMQELGALRQCEHLLPVYVALLQRYATDFVGQYPHLDMGRYDPSLVVVVLQQTSASGIQTSSFRSSVE